MRTTLTAGFLTLAMLLVLGEGTVQARSKGAKVVVVKCTNYCDVWAKQGPNTDTRWESGFYQFHAVKAGKTYSWWTTQACGVQKNFATKKGVYWTEAKESLGGCPGQIHHYKPLQSGTHKIPFTSRTDIKKSVVSLHVDKAADNAAIRKDVTSNTRRVEDVEDRTDDLEKRPGYGYLGLSLGFQYNYQLYNSIDPEFHTYGLGMRWEIWKPKNWLGLALHGGYSVAPTQRFIEGNPENRSVGITHHYLMFGIGLVFKPVRKTNFRLHIPIELLVGGVIAQLNDALVYQVASADVIYEDGDTESRFVLGGRVSLEFVLLKYWYIRPSITIQGTPHGGNVPFSNPLVPASRERFFEVQFSASTGVIF